MLEIRKSDVESMHGGRLTRTRLTTEEALAHELGTIPGRIQWILGEAAFKQTRTTTEQQGEVAATITPRVMEAQRTGDDMDVERMHVVGRIG